MKKLFIVLVIFLVFGSGVFAEITVSGMAGIATTLARGTNVIGDDIRAGNYIKGTIEAGASDENDTFGGSVAVSVESTPLYDQLLGTEEDPLAKPWSWRASAWYKPNYKWMIELGFINSFAPTDIVGWGYHANDAEDYVIAAKGNITGEYFSQTTGFYSGTGDTWTGLAVSWTPLYGLTFNLAIPFGRMLTHVGTIDETFDGNTFPTPVNRDVMGKIEDVYLFSHAQVSYNFYSIGTLALTFAGGGNGKVRFIDTRDTQNIKPLNPITDAFGFDDFIPNASTVYGSFLLTALENKGFTLNLGLAYTLPTKSSEIDLTYYSPIEAGLGISLGTAKYGVKARFAGTFAGKAAIAGGVTFNEPLLLGMSIMPYFSVKMVKFHLNAAVSYKWEDEYMYSYNQITTVLNSAALGWQINPYITVTAGSARFYAGFAIECDGLKYVGLRARRQQAPTETSSGSGVWEQRGTPIFEWYVPVGIQFDF